MGEDDGKPVGGCEGRKGYNYGRVGERGRSLSRGEGRGGEQQDADRVQ